MTDFSSPPRAAAPDHEAMLLHALRRNPAVPPSSAETAALAHVLSCSRCGRDLAGFWGADGACALARPWLAVYAAGSLPAALVAALETHLAVCPVCPALLTETRVAGRLAAMTPAERRAGELALALLEAALRDRPAARVLLLNWLGPAARPYGDVRRLAEALPARLVKSAARAAGPVDEARARAAGLAVLREHDANLSALDLRLDGDRLDQAPRGPVAVTPVLRALP